MKELLTALLIILAYVTGVVTVIHGYKPPPVAPQPSYVLRRVEVTLKDKRSDQRFNINPSYMQPNLRVVCEELPPTP